MLLRQTLLLSGKKVNSIKFPVFWDMTHCGLVYRYQRFGVALYFHLQGNTIRDFPQLFYDTASNRGREKICSKPATNSSDVTTINSVV